MTGTPPDHDPLRALLDEHWAPEAVDAAAFARGLARKQRAARWRRNASVGGALALAAAILLVLLVDSRSPSTPPVDAPGAWLAHTSAGASAPLPLPEEYAVIGAVFLSQRPK